MFSLESTCLLDYLKEFITGGCQIIHNLWSYPEPLSISADQEKQISIKNNKDIIATVDGVVIFILKDFNFKIADDLTVYSYDPQLKTKMLIYKIKKNSNVKNNYNHLQSHSCYLIPKKFITNPFTCTYFVNCQHSEVELKQLVLNKTHELNQKGIFYTVERNQDFTNILISNKTDIHFVTGESIKEYYVI